MELTKHIDKSGLTVIEYAKAVGVGQVTMYRALQGVFSPETAQKIFDYSEHKVELIIKPKRKDANNG